MKRRMRIGDKEHHQYDDDPPKEHLTCGQKFFIWLGICFVFLVAAAGLIVGAIALSKQNESVSAIQGFVEQIKTTSMPKPPSPEEEDICKWEILNDVGEVSYDCADSLIISPKVHFINKPKESALGSFIFSDLSQNIERAGIEFRKNGTIPSMDLVLQVGKEKKKSPFTLQYSKERNMYQIGIGNYNPNYGLDVETESLFSKPVLIRDNLSVESKEIILNANKFALSSRYIDINDNHLDVSVVSKFNSKSEFNGVADFKNSVIFEKGLTSKQHNTFDSKVTINGDLELNGELRLASSQTDLCNVSQLSRNITTLKIDLTNRIRALETGLNEESRDLTNTINSVEKHETSIINLNKKTDDLLSIQEDFHSSVSHIEEKTKNLHKMEEALTTLNDKNRMLNISAIENKLTLEHVQESILVLSAQTTKNTQSISQLSKEIDQTYETEEYTVHQIFYVPKTNRRVKSRELPYNMPPVIVDNVDMNKIQSEITDIAYKYSQLVTSFSNGGFLIDLFLNGEVSKFNYNPFSIFFILPPALTTEQQNGKKIQTLDMNVKLFKKKVVGQSQELKIYYDVKKLSYMLDNAQNSVTLSFDLQNEEFKTEDQFFCEINLKYVFQ